MNSWTPPPNDEQRAASRRSRRIAKVLALCGLVCGGGLFLVPGWPEWLGYVGGAMGLIGWFYVVRSLKELGPPDKGPFGREG